MERDIRIEAALALMPEIDRQWTTACVLAGVSLPVVGEEEYQQRGAAIREHWKRGDQMWDQNFRCCTPEEAYQYWHRTRWSTRHKVKDND